MKKSQQLYELIHSMSKSEKRYFKVNSVKESSIYVQIFDAIMAQPVYNSIALTSYLEKEGIKSSLARIQHHLYRLVLTSLSAFQTRKYPRYEVLSAIQQYIVLRDRGLHHQGRQLLQTALNTAQQYNYYGLTLEIYDLMEDWVTEEASYDEALKQKKFLEVTTKKHQDYTNSVVQLKAQIYELRLFFLKHKFARTAAQKIFLLQFLSDNKVTLAQEKNSLKRRLLLTILIYVYYGLQDYKQLLLTEKKRLELLEKSAFGAHISPFLVYAYHRNLLWILLRNKDYTAHQLLVQKIQGSNYWKGSFTATFYTIKLEIAEKVTQLYARVEQGHYRPAYPQMKELWTLYQTQIKYWDTNLLVNTLILFMNTTFCLGKYGETIDWLRLIEQEVPPAHLLPYRNMGKIAHLLLHDALGDEKYIQNVLESTRIRLYRKHDFFEVASLFLAFFKKKNNQKEENNQALLLQYKQKMQTVARQEGQKGFFILFNFVDWFDSKLQNCTIADLNRKF
jgi:hypothetical protein